MALPADALRAAPSESRVRPGAWIVIVLTLAAAAAGASFFEFKVRSAHMAMSNLPLVVLLPFVAWWLLSCVLQRVAPGLALRTTELRVMFCAIWVGGSLAGYNWATQWVGTMAAPEYFASPENRWRELVFDYLPWFMFPTRSEGVVESFYNGLLPEHALPWGAWLGPVFWAFSAAAAMALMGLGITAIFQKQWVDHERLTFPLAQVPLELTEGLDGSRQWPPIVRNRAFWIGFAVAAAPLLWNLIEYFVTGFPRITLFDAYYGGRSPRGMAISRYLPDFSYRLLPTVMGFTFLCDVQILFSIWSLYLVGLAARYGMTRVGFTVGLTGQEAKPPEIIGLFIHGVMLGLVLWSLWIARGHLRVVFRQAKDGERGDRAATAILSPRSALAAVGVGALYMTFWLHRAGYDLATGAVWLCLFWIGLFAAMKFLAASGFAYLFPSWGQSIPVIWAGTSRMSDSTIVAMRIVGWRLLAGWRLPPALPHVVRLLGRESRTLRIVIGALASGAVVAALYTIHLCYTEGGAAFRTWSLVGAPQGLYNGIAKAVSDTAQRTVPDPAKIVVWLVGIAAAAAATVAQARIAWWPFHPLGLLVMFDGYVRLYVLDIFIVWLAKTLVLRFGGIDLYRRVKPASYGLIVGYCSAVAVSLFVDAVWFPSSGHYIHGY